MAIRNYPEYKSTKDNYVYVEDVDKLVDTLIRNDTKILALDTETYYNPENKEAIIRYINGNPNNEPFCVTIYDGEKGYYISKDLDKLKRLVAESKAKFVFHNHKYDRHMLANIGIDFDISQLSDTMIMIHLIDEEFMCNTPAGTQVKSKKLKDLAYHFLGNDAHELEDMVGEYRSIKALHNKAEGREGGKDNVSYKEVELLNRDLMKDYACADVDFTYHLYLLFVKEIIRQNLKPAYALDMGASDTLFKMERRGVQIDKDYYENLYVDYAGELGRIDALILNIVDVDGEFECNFSVDSSKDIVKAFGNLGVVWAWYTDKKEPRTDKKILDQLSKMESQPKVVELANLILERRDIQKVRDTFIKNMLDYCQNDGRVHPDFNICPNDFNAGATRTR